ncbi:MAG: DUF3226 domain-containing protein [Acidobacteriota bacterium]
MADNYVLLVEGKDDDSVFFHLARHHQIQDQITIRKKDGFSLLVGDLDVELDASGLERLGIVVDADVDLNARWQSVRDRLLSCAYHNLPAALTPEGVLIEEPDRPTVGVWIMPDNTGSGMLEDFVRSLVPNDDLLWERAENCVNEIPVQARRFSSMSKAYIHTWLAWQEEPGTLMGSAINQHYLDADAPTALQFISWIRRLFDL